MKKLLFSISAVAITALTGCAGQNAAKGFAAMGANLAKDHALVIIHNDLMTPWGQQKGHIVRVGDLTNTVVISADGQVMVNPPAKP